MANLKQITFLKFIITFSASTFVLPYKVIGFSGDCSSQYLFFLPIPYPELVVKYIILFLLVIVFIKNLIEFKLIEIASFLFFSHNGAPTKAANGIINSFFLINFLINL